MMRYDINNKAIPENRTECSMLNCSKCYFFDGDYESDPNNCQYRITLMNFIGFDFEFKRC